MPGTDTTPATPARGRVGVVLPRYLPVQEVLPYALGEPRYWDSTGSGWWRTSAFAADSPRPAPSSPAPTHITVGIGIVPADARNVCFAAMELATLAQLYPGRLIAGKQSYFVILRRRPFK